MGQADLGDAEGPTGHGGCNLQTRSGLLIFGIGDRQRQILGDQSYGLDRLAVAYGLGHGAGEGLNGMGQGIHGRGGCQSRGQGHGETRIQNGRIGHDMDIDDINFSPSHLAFDDGHIGHFASCARGGGNDDVGRLGFL